MFFSEIIETLEVKLCDYFTDISTIFTIEIIHSNHSDSVVNRVRCSSLFKLILLQINKNGNVRLKPQVKENTEQPIA